MQRSKTTFSRVLENGKYRDLLESDANLRTDDGWSFDVHREILAKWSDYFRTMFEGWGERRREFHIPGISGGCLSEILTYIYTGEIDIDERNYVNILLGADYLLLDDLHIDLRSDVEGILNEVNCSILILVAYHLNAENIFQSCFRFIQTRFERIMKDDRVILHFPVDILEGILSNRSLYVYNETTVWNTIVAWTQEDILHRVSSLPRLLLTLAMEDMGEELATEILQHKIISQYCFMKDLAEIRSSNGVSNNIDVLLTLLHSCSNRFTKPILRHRTPPQLFVAWSKYKGEQGLYISYDENVDTWTQLTGMSSKPRALLAIGHNIYMFTDDSNERCKKFDLRALEWVRMRSYRYNYSVKRYCVVATDVYIYLLEEIRDSDKNVVQVYNTVNNIWRKGVPFRNISYFRAVAIEKKIYVVGKSKISHAMMMQMFDPDYQQWSIISPPTVHLSKFTMVAYHQKIYLIGCSDAEVFDPATNLWKKLPSAFGGHQLREAIVISDQIIICDTYSYGSDVRWNNAKECWENIDLNYKFRRYFLTSAYRDGLLFCTVDDVETIRIITKRNRDPGTQMEYLSE